MQSDSATPEIPPLPGINVAVGLHRMMNKTALYEKVLREFHARFRDEVEQLGAAIGGGAMDEARRRAHSIKGLAGSIGAEELQLAAQALERGIADGSADIGPLFQHFSGTLATVVGGIAAAYGLV